MSKQTAVNWLFEQLTIEISHANSFRKKRITKRLSIDEFKDIIQQAKQMEREQTMEAHDQGYADGYRDNGNSPAEYYEQTYGGNNGK
jgi:hypothetical protein